MPGALVAAARARLAALVFFVAAGALSGAAAAQAGGGGARRAPTSPAEITLSFAPIAKAAAPAVATIMAESAPRDPMAELRGMFERLEPPEQSFERRRRGRSVGSGVILSADGLVVTNHHVVAGAAAIRVRLRDRREFDAAPVLLDETTDLAILRLDGASGLPSLPWGDSDAVEVGDMVLAIGNPFGVGQTVTSGIVSARARTARSGQVFIQTDAAINPGNSGGALVDMRGRLIGVNSAILTRSGGSNGIGFAIPANLVRQAAAQAVQGARRLTRPWLGVDARTVDDRIARALGLERPEGVLLVELSPESPLAAAGLQRGDLVLTADGAPVSDLEQLRFRFAVRGFGERVEIELLTKTGRRAVSALVEGPPDRPDRAVAEIRAQSDLRGLLVANLNPALALELGEDPEQVRAPAVVVLGARGPAARFDLRGGDRVVGYNEVRVDAVADLVAAIRAAPRLGRLTVRRGDRLFALRLRR